jgi:RecA/RadA recombinase
MFDEVMSKLIPYTTVTRMVSALSVKFKESDVTEAALKYRGRLKTVDEHTRAPSINYRSGEYNCTCEDYEFTKQMCKHIIGLITWLREKHPEHFASFLEALGKPEMLKYATLPSTGTITTMTKTLDAMMDGGGIPASIITGFTGDPKIGKTWLAYQMCVASNLPTDMGGAGKPALYINTEADFLKPGVKETFAAYFRERTKRNFTIDFVFPRKLVDAFDLFGLGLDLKKSEKRVVPSVWDDTAPLACPIAELQRKKQYGLIVFDSMTNILKKDVPVPPNQNISSRATCINTLWGRFESIVEAFQIPMIVTHHCTKDPTSNAYGDPYGGDTVMYNMKHVIHLLHGTKDLFDRYGDGARRVMRARWPGVRSVTMPIILAVNMGFMDTPEALK